MRVFWERIRFLNHNAVAANEGSGEKDREREIVHQYPYYTYHQGPHSQAAVYHVVAVAVIAVLSSLSQTD